MCKFISGYVSIGGEIYCIPEYTDSHEVIARVFNLRDTECAWYRENLAKWECTPPANTAEWSDFSKWTVRADEDETPDWFDVDKIRDHVAKLVSAMFVRDSRGILLGGCWIFDGAEASAKGVLQGRIVGAFNGANLSGADLSRANLSDANLSRTNLSGANLYRADLYRTNLFGANLSDANLSGADLFGANLYRANLAGANLSGADLSGANLAGANLDGANLARANLSRTNLSRTNLSGAYDAQLPSGWKKLDNGIVVRE
jgi:hypothetical protein